MKRPPQAKRRGRCKPAPYTKLAKFPIEYSGEYAAWFRRVTGRSKRYNGSSFEHGRAS